jgi:hypothetical protein
MPARLRDLMLEKIKLCDRYDREKLLRRHSVELMQATGFTRAVLDLLTDQEVSEYTVEDMIKVLREVPSGEIRAVADEFVAAMETCSLHGHHVVDAAVEILTAASLWSHALKLSEWQENQWGDSEWDRQRKLHSQLRVLSCAIEYHSSQADLDKVRSCVSVFRQKEEELSQNEEKHRKRRDPLFGIGNQNQSS